MADVLEIVETQFVAVDKSTAMLNKMAGAAGKLDNVLNRVTTGLMIAGGLGGILGVTSAIHGVEETYRIVGRLKAVTGDTAENTHAMLDAFELAGVEGMTAERIITSMARKAGDVEDQMAGGAERARETAKFYKRLGIDMKAGPQEALLKMAEHSKDIQLIDLQKQFGVGKAQASQLLKMLQTGPEQIKKDMEATRNSGDLITEGALRNFEQMQRSKRELADAWQGLVGTVYKGLVPAFTKLIRGITAQLEKWEPLAERFGAVLADNMDKVVAGVKFVAKTLAVHKGLQLVGMGGIGKVATKIAAGESIGSLVAPIAKILGSFGRFVALGGVVLLIVKFVEAIIRNWDKLKGPVGRVLSAVQALWEAVRPVVGAIMKIVDILFDAFVSGPLLWALEAIAFVIKLIADAVKGIIQVVVFLGLLVGDLVSAIANLRLPRDPGSIWREAGQIFAEQVDLTPKPDKMDERAGGARPQIHQDFRNSKFDIKQDFAEGIEPGDVAVALTSDLAALGERQMTSGFTPIFSY